MKIAIQAADLDDARIDGTRVYLMQLLRRFGALGPQHEWHLYHRRAFNKELAPPDFPQYMVHTVKSPMYWTQIRFAFEMWRLRPDRLWMPVQALPFFLPDKVRTTVTIHDLAFKYFPDHFPEKDVRRLNWFTDFAVRKADKLIAISKSTKRDILKFYPSISPEKIRVIHHGFDPRLFEGNTNLTPLKQYGLEAKSYLLYVGALQPRKNLIVLLEAFELEKKRHPRMKLVLVGEKAWLWQETLAIVEKHPFRKDIILTGKVSFSVLSSLYLGARVFIFPSLYEGFGIPVLEAMAAGVPVICANNSSLPEAGGDAALYFDALNVSALVSCIHALWTDDSLYRAMVSRGYKHIQKFSWDACAQETMEYILS